MLDADTRWLRDTIESAHGPSREELESDVRAAIAVASMAADELRRVTAQRDAWRFAACVVGAALAGLSWSIWRVS